jgi:Ca2+:H+ antiporter
LLTLAVVVELLHAPVLLGFALSRLAALGVLNATFGNAAELIITIFALAAGLTTVVKASIIGSIIGNVLLVLGASLLLGGLKNGTQTFSATIAGINASMLAIVAAALALPTVFTTTGPEQGPPLTAFIALDGESNWLEGAMLCGVYVIVALALFFTP